VINSQDFVINPPPSHNAKKIKPACFCVCVFLILLAWVSEGKKIVPAGQNGGV
jgi:hypothetical protein